MVPEVEASRPYMARPAPAGVRGPADGIRRVRAAHRGLLLAGGGLLDQPAGRRQDGWPDTLQDR